MKKAALKFLVVPLATIPVLTTIISCNGQNNPQTFTQRLSTLDRYNTSLKNFDLTTDAINFLNDENGLNGKRYIIENAQVLFQTFDVNQITISNIDNFNAKPNEADSSQIQVDFDLINIKVNDDNTNPNLKETKNFKFTFNIGGFLANDQNIRLEEHVKQINQNFKAGKYYLVNPKISSTLPLGDDQTFETITEKLSASDLLTFIGNFNKVGGFRYQVKDFTNHDRVLSFKLSISDLSQELETDLLTFYSPSKIFDNFVLTTDLVSPNKNVEILDQTKAIALGNGTTGGTTVDKQRDAIKTYLQKKWFGTNGTNKKIDVKNGIFSFSLSENTNSYFSRVFGKNWKEVFSTENVDLNQTTLLIVGFKLNEKIPNITDDQVATFEFVPEYIQFSWKGYQPSWLTGGAHRIMLNDFKEENKIELKVKNVKTGNSGDLVNIN